MKHYLWVCLWVCLQKRLVFELVDWVKKITLLLMGIIQSMETLNRPSGGRKVIFFFFFLTPVRTFIFLCFWPLVLLVLGPSGLGLGLIPWPLVLRPFNLHQWTPGFQTLWLPGIQTQIELYHWLSWLFSFQMADHGIFWPPNLRNQFLE